MHGPAVKVSLSVSIMSAKNQLLNSKKIKGLVVRRFNCDDKLHIPVTFSREITPANRSHIPRWQKTSHVCGVSQVN